MQINPRFGRTLIFGFLTVLLLGGAIYGIWAWIQEARLPNLTQSEIEAMIVEGMTEVEVTEVLGRPKERVEEGNSSVWMYYNDPPTDFPTLILIKFRAGEVLEVILKSPKRFYPDTN